MWGHLGAVCVNRISMQGMKHCWSCEKAHAAATGESEAA